MKGPIFAALFSLPGLAFAHGAPDTLFHYVTSPDHQAVLWVLLAIGVVGGVLARVARSGRSFRR